MKNRSGFVPKSAKYQPVKYYCPFGYWCAVFVHPTTQQTLYLQLEQRTGFHNKPEDAAYVQILVQKPNYRDYVRMENYTSIRAAVAELEKIMDSPNEVCGFTNDNF